MSLLEAYGGCGCSGGAETASSQAMANTGLVKEIVGKIARLHNKKIDLSGSPSELVGRLREIIPDPRKKSNGGKGTAYGNNVKGNSALCSGMAEIINEAFGADVINTKAKPEEICDQIAEEMNTLAVGVGAQFYGVRKYTERILNNLKTLEELHNKAFARLEAAIKAADDAEDGSGLARTSVLREFHNDVHAEMDRQMHLLNNMLGVTRKGSDVDQELEAALKHSQQLKGFVRSIRNTSIGQASFGEKLGFLMAGTQSTAAVMAALEKAMSKLGVTRAELARSDSITKARELLAEKIEARLKPGADVGALLKAQQNILDRLYALKDLGAKDPLSGIHGGNDTAPEDYSDIEADIAGVSGGDQKLDKRIKERAAIRKGLVRQFGLRKAALWATMVRAADDFAKAVSTGRVKLSDKLDGFDTAMSLISTLSPNVYYALSGYYNDAAARQARETFIGNLEYVISTITALQTEAGYSSLDSLRSMKSSLEAIIKLIGEYSSHYETGFDTIAPPKRREVDSPSDLSAAARALVKGADDDDGIESVHALDNVEGGLDERLIGAAGAAGSAVMTAAACTGIDITRAALKCGGDEPDLENPALNKVADDLERTRELISYAFRTRRIRDNLAVMSSELPHYAEDYTKITADAVAEAIDRTSNTLNNWEKDNTVAKATPEAGPVAGSTNLFDLMVQAERLANPAATEPGSVRAATLAAATEMQRSSASARATMYRTAEAVDMYMQKFAALVASAPDDLRSVIDDVSDSHINAAWFTNSSGDAICKVFDACPSAYTVAYAPLRPKVPEGNEHYYVKLGQMVKGLAGGHNVAAVAAAATAVAGDISLPGNPYIGQLAEASTTGTIGFQAHVRLAADALKVTSLKNIIATFLNFADKFGGKQISSQIPMTIAEIYANLNQYIAVSAFTCARRPNVPAGGPLGAGTIATRAYGFIAGSTTYGGATVTVQSTGCDMTSDLERSLHLNATYAMRGIMGTAEGCYQDSFEETDKLFRMSIKSIVSKIFVARGMHDILNRPIQLAGLGYFNDLRLVVGGGAVVKVIPDALELYIRLPLLAEFYRTIFEFKGGAPADEKTITMVPEMDGTFTGLIAFIFDRAAHVTDGNYSDTEVATLISEINRIYERFSKSANPVMNSIDAFIAEVNARYGVVSRREQDAFLKARNARWSSSMDTVTPNETADFALPEFDEAEKYGRPMPSKMYELGRAVGDSPAAIHKHKLELDFNGSMLASLRGSIFEEFRRTQAKLSDTPSDEFDDAITKQREIGKRITLKHMLRARKEEMNYAKTDEDRFEIVRSAINSLGQYSLSALEKSYVAFHEYVLAPLNVLNSVYNEVEEYRDHIARMWRAATAMKRLSMIGAVARTCAQWVALINLVAANRDTPDTLVATVTAAAAANGGIPADTEAADLLAIHAFARAVEEDPAAGAAALLMPAGPADWTDQGGIAPVPTWVALDTAAAAGGLTAEQRADVAMRFVLNNDRLMRQLLETIYQHGCTLDKFVDLRIEVVTRLATGSNCAIDINVDHSKLIEHVQSTITMVKNVFAKFRGLLPEEKIKMYEDVNCNGSIFWLERHFLDALVRGRGKDVKEADSIDRSNGRIKQVLDFLTRSYSIRADRGALAAGTQQHSYLATLATMIAGGFAVVPLGGALPAPAITYESAGITPFASYYNRSNKTVGAVAPGTAWTGAPANRSEGILLEGLGAPNGAVAQMNSLLAALIGVAYDGPTQKMFAPIINEFANGAASAAVMGGATQQIDDGAATDARVVLGQKNTLYKSVAFALQHFVIDKAGDGKTPLYLDSDVANLQTYSKEQMRSELPLFMRMFQELIRRCDFLKYMVTAFCVTQYAGIAAHDDATYAADRTAKQLSAQALLDAVISGSMALHNGCKEGLKLIGDDPKYFELSQDFISNYRALNSCDPLMPLSSSAVVLRAGEVSGGFVMLGLPGAKYSTAVQKVHYGLRGVLQGEVRAAAMPGVIEIAKGHNQSCDKRFQVDESAVVALANAVFELERYVVGVRVQRAHLVVNRVYSPAARGLAPTQSYLKSGSDATYVADPSALLVYSFPLIRTNTIDSVVRMTETNAQKNQRRAIVQIVERVEKCNLIGDRRDMVVFNLIDTGKVPIVLHALMRDMPLLMLHLYSGEFDKSVDSVFGTNTTAGRAKIEMRDVPTGRDMLAEMLVNPHAKIDDDVYDVRFAQIVRGDLSIAGLAQPKMLGQELYSKALIGEIYPGQVYAQEETDPALGDAHLRGKQEVLKDGPMRDLRGPLVLQRIFEVLFGAGGVWPNAADWKPYLAAALVGGLIPFAKLVGDVAAKHIANSAGATVADVPVTFGAFVAPAALRAGGAPNAAQSQWIADMYTISKTVLTLTGALSKFVAVSVHDAMLGNPARNPGTNTNVEQQIRLTFAQLHAAFSAGIGVGNLNLPGSPAINIPLAGAATTAFSPAETDAWLAVNQLNLAAAWKDVPRGERLAVQKRNPRYFPAELMYMKLDNKSGKMAAGSPEKVDVGTHKDLLQAIGKLRFDTYFARNIIWMTNIQRFVLLKLSTDYTWSNSKVVSGPAILARGNTEFYGNDMLRDKGRSHAPGNYKY